MKNNATRTIRSEEITIDVRICAALAANRGSGEVYLAAIAPDMELTVITPDEAPGILPCFDEDDACLNLPDTSLLLCYNPAQVLKMRGKHYLTGPVILARTNMDGEVVSLTIDEVYLAAIAPDMELTVITLDEAPDILPCFDEDDACLNLPDTSLLLCYNPAQVLKMGGKHYLTGPVILVRTNMDGEVISLTIDEVYLFQKYMASHSITLMADDQKLPCICID